MYYIYTDYAETTYQIIRKTKEVLLYMQERSV